MRLEFYSGNMIIEAGDCDSTGNNFVLPCILEVHNKPHHKTLASVFGEKSFIIKYWRHFGGRAIDLQASVVIRETDNKGVFVKYDGDDTKGLARSLIRYSSETVSWPLDKIEISIYPVQKVFMFDSNDNEFAYKIICSYLYSNLPYRKIST